ncbi:MAG TPA: CRISPR-associated endonuclease Cas2 [Candidatus Paceibacterota bacterium]|jgi:DNA-binding transcriptional regulator PaaX|nr:CRISPR-associated endonuclease Cas2 [Candidatus Paceibacterota bacterium]
MPYYKGIKVNAFGLPVSGKHNQHRIKQKNRKRNFYHKAFLSPFKKDSSKNLIVMYDVTEEKKKERDWFRRQLKNFDYIMIQRSVWVGPSPLPKEFLNYVKEVGLQDHLKTFKLAKAYSGKDNLFK